MVLVNYDSEVVTLSEIYRLYFRNIDPLDGGGQFCDRGDSYRPVIFTENDEERNEASKSLLYVSKELGVQLEQIKVELKPKRKFWEAEDYHQDYKEKNPNNAYIWNVSVPRINKFKSKFSEILKQ